MSNGRVSYVLGKVLGTCITHTQQETDSRSIPHVPVELASTIRCIPAVQYRNVALNTSTKQEGDYRPFHRSVHVMHQNEPAGDVQSKIPPRCFVTAEGAGPMALFAMENHDL